MNKCKNCGHILSDNDKFCPECGEKVFKRTVIYSPRAEDIVVIDDDNKEKKPKRNSANYVETLNLKESNVFIKIVKIIYQIIISAITIIFLISSFGSFTDSKPIFGITCLFMAMCSAGNIYVFRTKKWRMFIFTFIAFFVIAIVGYDISAKKGEMDVQHTDDIVQNNINAKNEPTKILSKEEYITLCEDYEYKDIARYPDEYKGRKAHFNGKVVQVSGDSGTIQLRVNVTFTEGSYYDSWDDTVWVEYTYKDGTRILEDDVIDIYGTLMGIYTYTSVMDVQISIPGIYAEYITINNLE